MSISEPPNYGSPDWQRGYYSAQKLIATGLATDASKIVQVPPNAENIILALGQGSSNPIALCVGQTTGIQYTGTQLYGSENTYRTDTFIFDVSAAVDSLVEIGFTAAPGVAWWAYADAGVHLVSDIGTRKTVDSAVYTVSAPPSTAGGDHPPTELQIGTIASSQPTAILPAPGASQRYRIFSIAMMISGGTSQGTCTAYLYGSKSGQYFHGLSTSGAEPPGASVNRTFPLTGLAMQAGESLNLGYDVGAGTLVRGSVLYTLENI
jgi:hypothetical protein